VNDHSRGHTSRNLLPSDATDIVRVTLIVAKHIGTVEHHDPRVFRMVFEGRGRPIGQVIPKGNLLRITGWYLVLSSKDSSSAKVGRRHSSLASKESDSAYSWASWQVISPGDSYCHSRPVLGSFLVGGFCLPSSTAEGKKKWLIFYNGLFYRPL